VRSSRKREITTLKIMSLKNPFKATQKPLNIPEEPPFLIKKLAFTMPIEPLLKSNSKTMGLLSKTRKKVLS
jgi:hypothetical protein